MTTWQVATVVGAVRETDTARSIWLHIPGFPGARAGQHIDIKLTAPDGYSTSRSYSLSDVREGDTVAVGVEELDDGEVSPFLVHDLEIGEQVEIAGPIGMQFVWPPLDTGAGADSGTGAGADKDTGAGADTDPSRPVQLVAGGSGITPLMAMIRLRETTRPEATMRLLYSARSPEQVFFRDEFAALAAADRLRVDWFFTRTAGSGPRPAGRITREEFAAAILPVASRPLLYLCGSTEYVDTLGEWLLDAGYPIDDIRIERFLAA
ncbi:MAG: FAD-binding oxidoreductase [Corynebacteriales bacterium]|nr:FAD-binding oxidoreductase [Mycobacteriales bacterium]